MEHDDGESGFLIKTIQFNGSIKVSITKLSSESALFDLKEAIFEFKTWI